MKSALSFALVLAACKTLPVPPPPEPAKPDPVATVSDAAPPVDPTLLARRAYANPGGMWMPQQMTLPGHEETFARLGVAIDPAKLADPLAEPLAAIVRLNGCSGSFVSAEGLVITNHHCVQTALQANSKPENNRVEHGMLATTRAGELPAGPSERIFVAQAFTDVSAQIRDKLDAVADPVARKDLVERRVKQQIAACEKDRPGIRCKVGTYFRGGTYVLIEELEIRDVRLVYVPARSIGNYGGEIDNWKWPRHTGDFAFFRAYVGKDGKPADYSVDNVPYQPKHVLAVSAAGVKASDFVMIAGFPGRTTRTKTATEVQHDVEVAYPLTIELAKQRYAIMETLVAGGGDTGIKAGVQKQRIQNAMQKTIGVLAGLTSGDLLVRKADLDRRAKAWASAAGREQHAAGIAKLEALILDEQRTARADFARGFAFGAASQLLATAIQVTRWADERTKPDAEREPGFQERDVVTATAAQRQLTKQYDAAIDRAQLRLALVRALALPAGERAWLPLLLDTKKATIDEALIDKTLDAWYKASKFSDEKTRVDLLTGGTKAKLAASKDPFVRAAGRVWNIYKDEEKRADAQAGEAILVAPIYVDAMREALGGLLAPDANSTVRITYGTVKAFAPEDAAFTNGSQLVAKDTGKDPFDAPAKLIAALKAKDFGPYAGADGELPVDFLSDLDTTGGNSGSAVLDDHGRLVALNFDSTLQGVASDVVFDSATTRKIHVDIRYVLWIMDRVDGADHLLTEMGLTPKLASP